MKKFKKIILLLAILISVLVSCYRIDTGEQQNSIVLLQNEENNTSKTIYNPSTTTNVNGIDYKVSNANIGEYGGQIISSSIGEGPKTFNPWTSKDATSSLIGDILYSSLFSTDPNTGEVIPNLAKEMSVSEDLMKYKIKLRQGAKWSDGKEITADDVVFTWNEIILAGLGNTSIRDSVLIDGEYPQIKVIDKYTVEFKIKKPFAPFQRIIGTSIAPKHIFKSATSKGERYFNSYLGTTTNPKDIVASGPFLLEEYVPAQRVVLKRNPHYFAINKEGNKLPYIDKYIILIVGDLNNELLKFESGELDIISIRGKDLSRFKQKEKKSDFKIYNLGPNTGTLFITFNLNDRKDKNGKYYVDPIKQKWFNDINFRTAIDYAIDRNAMIYNVLNGVAQPLFTSESLSSIFLNEKLAAGHPKDIEYAKNILKDAGYYWDNKGLLHDKENNLIEFNLYTNAGNTEREACGVMIKEDLKALGIRVNFKPIEFNSLVSKMMTTADWDVVLMGLTGSPLEPHNGKNVWYSKGHLHLFNMRFPTDKNDNLLAWEKEIDEIIEKGALELDYNKRKVFYDKYQQIIYDERPIIYLYSPLTIVAVRNKIKNLYPTPLGGTMHNLEELYIDKNQE